LNERASVRVHELESVCEHRNLEHGNMGAESGMEHGIGCIDFETTKLVADGWFEHIKRALVF
jgi:hypothetical protein